MRAHVYRQTSLNPTEAFKHDNINYFSDQCAFTELQNDEPDYNMDCLGIIIIYLPLLLLLYSTKLGK